MTSTTAINAGQELKVTPSSNADTTIRLVNGHADIFGMPLREGEDIIVPAGRSVCVTTSEGTPSATVRITGGAKVSTQPSFLGAAYAPLCDMMDAIRVTGKDIPKVLIAGNVDVGKSTIASYLCNVGVRKGYGMVYVDADLGQGSITVPGTISAVFVDNYVHFAEGFNRSTALSYFYGDTSLGAENLPRYSALCENLRLAVEKVSSSRPEISCGGIILNTMGWITGPGYECIRTLIRTFGVNLVVSVGENNLVDTFTRDYPTEIAGGRITVLSRPAAPGIVSRDRAYRSHARAQRIHMYFYGSRPGEVTPFKTTLKMSDFKLYWACGVRAQQGGSGSDTSPSSSALEPLPVAPIPMDPRDRKKLAGYLCAVVHASSDADVAKNRNVAGFLAVLEVDVANDTFDVLLPNADPLPSNYILVSRSVKFEPGLFGGGVNTTSNNNNTFEKSPGSGGRGRRGDKH